MRWDTRRVYYATIQIRLCFICHPFICIIERLLQDKILYQTDKIDEDEVQNLQYKYLTRHVASCFTRLFLLNQKIYIDFNFVIKSIILYQTDKMDTIIVCFVVKMIKCLIFTEL